MMKMTSLTEWAAAVSDGDVDALHVHLQERGMAWLEEYGVDALVQAAGAGQAAIVAELLKTGVDVNAFDGEDTNALFAAAEHARVEVVEMLLQAGADANAVDPWGYHPLNNASSAGSLDCVRLLLAHGADPRIASQHGKPVLIDAVWSKNTQMVRFWLERGEDVNECHVPFGTALDQACIAGAAEIVELSLSAGALTKNTATSVAWLGHTDIVRALLDAGTMVDAPDTCGNTPLVAAAAIGCLEEVEMLLQAGADVNAHTGTGLKTPLIWACESGCVDVVRCLLEHGADVHTTDRNGMDALAHAMKKGKMAIVALLCAKELDDNLGGRNA